VGLKKAKELAFFADRIPAGEAERLGLVNCAVPAGELEAQLKEWTARLAAGPTTALSLSKAMLNDAYELSFEQAIEEESRAQTINSAAQGSRATLEGALKKPSA
jgi:2-(1,2-epoxy-1,2-dihydrophenyl)acetyl-CoA isomerase